MLTNAVAYEGMMAVIHRLFNLANTSSRLLKVIRNISHFPPESRKKLLTIFSKFADQLRKDTEREVVWEGVRSELARHRTYASAAWALTKEEANKWDIILSKLEPKNSTLRNKWLFDDWFPNLEEEGTIEKKKERLAVLRKSAVEKIWTTGGLKEIVHFTKSVKQPSAVAEGLIALKIGLKDVRELIDATILLDGHFYSFLAYLSEYAHSNFLSSKNSKLNFIKERLAKANGKRVSADGLSMLVINWPRDIATWKLLEKLPQKIAPAYPTSYQGSITVC